MNISNPSEMVDFIIFIKLGESKMIMNDLDSIHFEINRIYEQWDEGEITYEKAMEQVKDVYKIFVKEISDEKRF